MIIDYPIRQSRVKNINYYENTQEKIFNINYSLIPQPITENQGSWDIVHINYYIVRYKIIIYGGTDMAIDIRLERLHDYLWRIPQGFRNNMLTDVHIYGSKSLVEQMKRDNTLIQACNVASLPGLVGNVCVLPDGHQGYGFPIGGVAGFDIEDGIISPGGVGYDINCGIRLLVTDLTKEDVMEKQKKLSRELFRNVPSGVGSKSNLSLNMSELKDILRKGSKWAVEHGYGREEDLIYTEEGGQMKNADPSKLSQRALKRGLTQMGTLGAGNHFLEVQVIEKIFDEKIAKTMGITGVGQIVVMLHCGSRGLGHQVCGDYIKVMHRAVGKYRLKLPDRELVCAPIESDEAADYISAMNCAVNYAFCNRQILTHNIREVFRKLFSVEEMPLVYDVCHNIAKFETHIVDNKKRTLCVHRKGCTRAFGPGRSEIPQKYRTTGQPVIIPGDMGTASYLLVGTERAMKESLGTANHGAGRVMSRTQAKKTHSGEKIRKELEYKGISVIATSPSLLSEEAPDAYKNISIVVDSVDKAGIAKKVAKARPICVTKG